MNGGLRPRERRRRLLDDLVPGSGEPALRALLGERPLALPLAARLLVVDLEAVAVGIREVDADGHGVVRHADGHVLGLQPLVHLGEVLETAHAPGHVVQTHALLLGPGRVLAHLEQGDVVGMVAVARQESRPQLAGSGKRHGVLRVQPEDVRVPLVRPLGVAHEDVDVIEGNGLVGHVLSPAGRVDSEWKYTAGAARRDGRQFAKISIRYARESSTCTAPRRMLVRSRANVTMLTTRVSASRIARVGSSRSTDLHEMRVIGSPDATLEPQ